MKILDIDDIEVPEDEVDLEKGYLTTEQVLKEHHAAVPEQKETFHYEMKTWYFEDGTQLDVSELGNADPHVKIVDLDNGVFEYIDQGEGKTYRGADVERVVDQEHVEGKDAWDEYEEIQRYTLYTEEQLEQKEEERKEKERKDELLSSGLQRIEHLEEQDQKHETTVQEHGFSIEHLQNSTEQLSETAGDHANQIQTVSSDVEDIILIVSELIGMEMEDEMDWDEELGDFVNSPGPNGPDSGPVPTEEDEEEGE